MHEFKIPCQKILIVGDGHVGKTSLTKRLKEIWFYPLRKSQETKGLDKHQLEYGTSQHVTIWDFAGQQEFLATHRLFLRENSVFIVVIKLSKEAGNTLDNTIEDTLKRWLFIIDQQAPESSIMVVGTHLDELKTDSTEHEIRHRICLWVTSAMKSLSLKFITTNEPSHLVDEQIVQKHAMKSIVLISNSKDKNIHSVQLVLRGTKTAVSLIKLY